MNEAVFPNILIVAVLGLYLTTMLIFIYLYRTFFFPDKEMKKKLNATNKVDFIL